MLEEIKDLTAQGQYEKAYSAAKRLSVDLLRDNRREEAAIVLARAAEVLCALNNPSKARSFTREALDLATRSENKAAAGYAYAVSALAALRLGQIEPAEAELDRSLELTAGQKTEYAALARLVAAEVSLSKEDYAEARAFAEDASATAAELNEGTIRARALLIKAICEERSGRLEAAIELLRSADAQLAQFPEAEAAWQIKSALANALDKSGDGKRAALHRSDAAAIINRLAMLMSAETQERYLKNPAVASALGSEASKSSIFRMPVQIPPQAPATPGRSDTTLMGFRPILELIRKINSELNLRNLITTILDTMLEVCNAERGTIVVFEGDRFKIEISRSRGGKPLDREEMGISRGILKMVRDTGKKIVTQDAQQDPELRLIDTVQEQQLTSILCVPLRVKLRLVGAVYLDNRTQAGAFGRREIEIAEILTDHAAVAIDNALLHIKSIHDTLTNLYNHPHFEKRLLSEVNRARRHDRPCSILMLDLDNFKQVNDSLGHHAGNELLRAVAKVLAKAVRSVDLVARIQEKEVAPVLARYGGDEFEIVLPETGRDGARKVGERILEMMAAAKFQYEDKPIRVAASIGGATFPEDAPDGTELLLRADEALYAAKRSGKNRYMAYSDIAPRNPA